MHGAAPVSKTTVTHLEKVYTKSGPQNTPAPYTYDAPLAPRASGSGRGVCLLYLGAFVLPSLKTTSRWIRIYPTTSGVAKKRVLLGRRRVCQPLTPTDFARQQAPGGHSFRKLSCTRSVRRTPQEARTVPAIPAFFKRIRGSASVAGPRIAGCFKTPLSGQAVCGPEGW